MFLQLTLLLLVGSIVVADAAAVGSKEKYEFKVCHRSQVKEFDKCLDDAIQDTLHRLKAGVPQLGIATIDPMPITKMEIDQGTGPVTIKLTLENIKLLGISESKIFNTKSDLDNYNINSEGLTPKLQLLSDYTLSGKVLLLPIRGKGKANLTFDQLSSKVNLKMQPFMKDGKKYSKANLKYSFHPKSMNIQFDNLFDGDKTLGDGMNKFLNENWEVVLSELKSPLNEGFSQVFTRLADQFYSRVPFDDVFPK